MATENSLHLLLRSKCFQTKYNRVSNQIHSFTSEIYTDGIWMVFVKNIEHNICRTSLPEATVYTNELKVTFSVLETENGLLSQDCQASI